MNVLELRGSEALPYVDAMAKLRIEVFSEWPYLYKGDAAYERKYLQTYFESANSFIVLAIEGSQVVGMSTAVWLPDAEPAFQEPFLVKGFDAKSVCYYGESVVLRGRRGRGLGREFMRRREAFARSLPGVQWAAFCAVVRPKHHPRKPEDATVLDHFWMRDGFVAADGMTTSYLWTDIGETSESPKPMQFWIKHLGNTDEVAARDLLKNYYAAFNQREWDRMCSLLSKDVRHDINQGAAEIGRERFREFLSVMDRHYSEKVLDLQVFTSPDGRRAAAEFFIEGVYKESQEGLPPASGQFYRLPVGAFFDIEGGRIRRLSNHYNLKEWIEKVKA